jgi:hypothetical protein
MLKQNSNNKKKQKGICYLNTKRKKVSKKIPSKDLLSSSSKHTHALVFPKIVKTHIKNYQSIRNCSIINHTLI